LSPRTLYFGYREIFWECGSGVADESQSSIKHGKMMPGHLGTDFKPQIRWLFNSTFDVSDYKHVSLWDALITSYTNLDLTYPTDRWAAIAGVLSKIARKSSKTLVAGHIEEVLETQLVWSVTKPTKRLANGAPSWSWLSVEGPIMRHSTRGTQDLSTISIMRVPYSTQIKQLWNGSGPQGAHPLTVKGSLLKLHLNAPKIVNDKAFLMRELCANNPMLLGEMSFFLPDLEDAVHSNEIWLLQLSVHFNNSEDRTYMEALVLIPKSPVSERCARAGVCYLHYQGELSRIGTLQEISIT
jgi:hypothetical protein